MRALHKAKDQVGELQEQLSQQEDLNDELEALHASMVAKQYNLARRYNEHMAYLLTNHMQRVDADSRLFRFSFEVDYGTFTKQHFLYHDEKGDHTSFPVRQWLDIDENKVRPSASRLRDWHTHGCYTGPVDKWIACSCECDKTFQIFTQVVKFEQCVTLCNAPAAKQKKTKKKQQKKTTTTATPATATVTRDAGTVEEHKSTVTEEKSPDDSQRHVSVGDID